MGVRAIMHGLGFAVQKTPKGQEGYLTGIFKSKYHVLVLPLEGKRIESPYQRVCCYFYDTEFEMLRETPFDSLFDFIEEVMLARQADLALPHMSR